MARRMQRLSSVFVVSSDLQLSIFETCNDVMDEWNGAVELVPRNTVDRAHPT